MRWSTSSKLPTAAPVQFNFMPSWWHRHYGISFGERMFSDPEYRARMAREMHRLAHERFGEVGLGESNPEMVYFSDDLSNATLPAAFGCPVVCAEDNYPVNSPLPEEELRKISLPEDITKVYPFREIIRQAESVNTRHNADLHPSWNVMGVQNIAVQIAGSNFFVQYYTDPELAKRLLDDAREMMVRSLNYFLSVGSRLEFLCNANCTVPLAGPKIYRDHLFAQEERLYTAVTRQGIGYAIHHCGHFDDYADLYRKIKHVVFIEIGWGSDLRLALDLFPEAKVQYIVSFQFIQDGPPKKIKEFMQSIIESAGPDVGRLSFHIADLEYGIPDEHVRAVVEGLLKKGGTS